ncbi:RES family NAD+ phosphorylase [Rheinheimera sp. WS51]|uniref:RES family NAD+ phosphorylase n=1 Tax=Rheinheimera sp. WS51 TaxID=3425886 RepID=UPI003D923802
MDKPSETRLPWQARRIIPSLFPPIDLFERVLDPAEYEAAFYIESLTNDRLRDQVGDLALVKPEDRISGCGTTPIMAAFTHVGHASRFTDGSFGVYYAANNSKTAIAETAYHRAKFYQATNEPDTRIYMREYVGAVIQPMLDITAKQYQPLHDPDSYLLSQNFAKQPRQENAYGLLYNSVRYQGGLCIAVFRPSALQPVIQAAHYEYFYSAELKRIKHVLHVSEVKLKSSI